ncbi:DUF2894 domain-containing protein [Variovorax sp. PAMC28562]|nr:DUF2894 domain-containing protein [Variovorax sp. PAMC28562]
MDHGATLDALRARGDHRIDPVRFGFIEVLARRALLQQGAARRILDDRLAQLLSAYGEDVERARFAREAAQATSDVAGELPGLPGAPGSGSAVRSALAELAGRLAPKVTGDDGAIEGSMPRTLKYFRSTWSKLSAERHLSQSHATVPDNPGPLNSHHLVHQALKSMRDLSPGYLSHFMSHVDALLWLDDANAVAAVSSASAQRDAVQKKPARKSSRESKGGI